MAHEGHTAAAARVLHEICRTCNGVSPSSTLVSAAMLPCMLRGPTAVTMKLAVPAATCGSAASQRKCRRFWGRVTGCFSHLRACQQDGRRALVLDDVVRLASQRRLVHLQV